MSDSEDENRSDVQPLPLKLGAQRNKISKAVVPRSAKVQNVPGESSIAKLRSASTKSTEMPRKTVPKKRKVI